MPDIVVHTRFGAEVLDRLELEVDRRVYDFGLMGPDPYLFYHWYVPPFRNRVNRYSAVMHTKRTGDFLIELSRRARESLEVFSYLCGFLCHYALDSTAHPYINRLAKYRSIMHMAIEHRLDVLSGGDIRIPPFLPQSMREDIGGAIEQIYGWDDAWDKLRDGRRDMASCYRIAADESGKLDRLTGRTHTDLRLLSYRSKALDGLDLSGFDPLYRRALDDAVRFIAAAQTYVGGNLDESTLREVIGSRSYNGE